MNLQRNIILILGIIVITFLSYLIYTKSIQNIREGDIEVREIDKNINNEIEQSDIIFSAEEEKNTDETVDSEVYANNEIINWQVQLEEYCTSQGVKLILEDYYYFNYEANNDGITGICKGNYNRELFFIVKKGENNLKEIFKYRDRDLSKYIIEVFNSPSPVDPRFIIDYPFEKIKIEDINGDGKDEVFFYSADYGGTDAGCTEMIYLYDLDEETLHYMFRYINGGPDKTEIKDFFFENSEERIKNHLSELMNEWFISIYGENYK